MKRLLLLTCAFPGLAFADDFNLTSAVTHAEIYPSGATLTRQIPYEIPAGQHRLVIADLPQNTDLESARVTVDGAKLGAITYRNDFVAPHDPEESEDYKAAEAEVERIEEALRLENAKVERIRLEVTAAKARISFLKGLGERDEAVEVDQLRALSQMVGEETLAALQMSQDAKQRADAAHRALKDLREDLARAKQALAALVPQPEDFAMLAANVQSDQATNGVLTITYFTHQAYWQPTYDFRYARDSETLTIDRGALVAQGTGGNWVGADITLSTTRPSENIAPRQVWPHRLRIEDPQVRRVQSFGDVASSAKLAEPMIEAPVLAEETSVSIVPGISATYHYSKPLDLASGADAVRLSLGSTDTQATIAAHAVPRGDDVAFAIVDFKNDTGELLLNTEASSFYLDGRYVGKTYTDLIAGGDSYDLPFGPIEGLRLKRVIKNRNEGDRGFVSKSNEITESADLSIENLTDEEWQIHMIDRVPYSEQEDLVVKWEASIKPSHTDLDDQRGVLAWDFDLAGGKSKTITLSHGITWPEGKELH